MAEDFVPAAGSAAFTGAYDAIIAITARETKLRGGVVEAVRGATAEIEAPRILEIGCGTGTLSIALAQAVPKAEVTGIDIDPQALAIAREKAGAESVTWLEGTATAAPPDVGTWDCVVISLVLHHLKPETQPRALENARAALKPGGTVHIVDFGPPHGPLPKIGWRALQRVDGVRNTTPLGRGDLPGMIDDAGFADRRRLQRFGTCWGTHERFSAVRPA
jgi:SAM-dependent methyltransferase